MQNQSRHRLYLQAVNLLATDSRTVFRPGRDGEAQRHRSHQDFPHLHALFSLFQDTKLLNCRKKTMKSMEV